MWFPPWSDAGLQKDQGDEVLVEPGLIVLSLNKHSSAEILNANIIIYDNLEDPSLQERKPQGGWFLHIDAIPSKTRVLA